MKQVKLRIEDGPNGKRIFLGSEYPDIYLTIREAELAQLLGNYKYREIAELLKVSRRTIEYYTMNMKKKLHCRNKRELIYVIQHSGLLEQLKLEVDISYLFEAKQLEEPKDSEKPEELDDSLAEANAEQYSKDCESDGDKQLEPVYASTGKTNSANVTDSDPDLKD